MMGSLRRHWLISLVVIVIVLSSGSFVAFKKRNHHLYESEARIFVSPRVIDYLHDTKVLDPDQEYRRFIGHMEMTVKRYDIAFDALQKLGDRRFDWLGRLFSEKHDKNPETYNDRYAAEELQHALIVFSIKDTYLMVVYLQSSEKNDVVLNSVIKTFVEKVNAEKDLYFGKNNKPN